MVDKRHPRPATQTDVESVRGRVSDAKDLMRGGLAQMASHVAAIDKEQRATAHVVTQLLEARKEDRIHLRWLITTLVTITIGGAIASFASCIHQREDIAQIKATLEYITKGK